MIADDSSEINSYLPNNNVLSIASVDIYSVHQLNRLDDVLHTIVPVID